MFVSKPHQGIQFISDDAVGTVLEETPRMKAPASLNMTDVLLKYIQEYVEEYTVKPKGRRK